MTLKEHNERQRLAAAKRIKRIVALRRQSYTFKEIGALLGVTAQRAQQLAARGIR